jgi:transposase InsO family protein
MQQSARTPTIPEIKHLLTATKLLSFKANSKAEAYQWIEEFLRATCYWRLSKKERGVVKQYIRKMTGYSRTQTTELIGRSKRNGHVKLKQYHRHSFARTYTDHDVVVLAETDDAHDRLSAPATVKIMTDEYQLFGDREYERLSKISPAHIYNLRGKHLYRATTTTYTKTQAVARNIGERRKPEPSGQPGFLRVDSVHGGDSVSGDKGVYYVNLVDEVTQWEVVVCVQTLCERHLKYVLQMALVLIPFKVLGIHADNGSEYINHWVARLCEKIRAELTKTRPRHSNDNALVETKNGSVIRKHLGYNYIPKHHAEDINAWCLRWLMPYLNFHRPCGFAKEVMVGKHGKVKKKYPKENYLTPYQKLKSLLNSQEYLTRGHTFAKLDKQGYAKSHTQFARQMNQAKLVLFKKINP